MKSIVCPTDFSERSITAARYAADMACVMNMSLCLVHVCALPVTLSEIPLPPYPFDHTISEAEQQLAALKEELALRTNNKIKIYTDVRQGFLMSELTEYCDKIQPYAVVMGAENASTLERMVVGASTFAAITKLPWPVIVVPPDAVFSGIRKIALACDLEDVVNAVPENEIVSIVKAFNAELHVVHIGGDSGVFSPSQVAQSGLLQEMLSQVDPVYHFIRGGDVEVALVDFLDQHDFDLLFVFPKHHNLLSGIFHRSHSKKLVTQSHIPVMAMHENRS